MTAVRSAATVVVDALSQEVEKSKGYIARAEGQSQAQSKVASDAPSLLALEG